mmetsp:Transcript_15060/g.13215  ORF Transcript_15060/g.13215 Transcript_15060/m.13215 type:complete len:437 (+) Transcript_15060:258-1568(+)
MKKNSVYNKRIKDLQESIKGKEEEIVEYDDKDIKKDRETLKITIKEEYVDKEADFDTGIEGNRDNYRKIEEKLDECSEFEENKQDIEDNIERLKSDLEREKKEHETELAEKEEEKHQAIEKLRKDMLFQIKETKAQLLSLNDAELQNTTKLTIQQNHQLTSELEFQSKQTETLLYKNNKMSDQIIALRKDIEIHKQVENELAKRSHFCQKVIKKLRSKLKELAEEISNAKKNKNPKTKTKNNDKWDGTKKEELIGFLESKLEEIRKRLENTQNKYDGLKKRYILLYEKLKHSREKYRRTVLLLTDYLDELLNSSEQVLSTDQDMHLNLDEIKEANVDIKDMEAKDKIALILVLLKQLQPYITEYIPDHPSATELLVNQKEETDTTETLNRILNNIKVQTKRSEMGSRETASRGIKKRFGKEKDEEFRLPPINKHQN